VTWRTNILNHYRTVWGVEPGPCSFSAGPISELPLDFSVIKFSPHGKRQMWTYATCCMSQPVDHRPIELHMFSPWESDEVVELLVVTAHYHRTAAKLDLGHSVNFGRPWMGTAKSEYGLVSLPYLDGPSLENLKTDSKELKFYWLIPVTYSEVEFKKQNGLEALEELFDRTGFDYLNPERSAVA
jgi:Suppressor of fused protein (SUFU)